MKSYDSTGEHGKAQIKLKGETTLGHSVRRHASPCNMRNALLGAAYILEKHNGMGLFINHVWLMI